MSPSPQSRPLPPSVLAFRKRQARKAPPPVIFGQDLTLPEPEPTYAAELRWTAGWIAAGVLVPMTIVAAIAGPTFVWRAIWAAVSGQPL